MNAKEVSQIMNQIHQAFLRINELNYRIQRARHEVVIKAEGLKKAENLLTERQASHQKLEIVAQELEHEADFVSRGLKRRREQLNVAKSAREYDSLKLQIEMDEAKSNRLTDETIVALSNLEKSEIELAEIQKRYKDDLTAWETANKEFHLTEAETLQEIQKTLERSKKLSENLPMEHGSIIARLVNDGNEPLAPIIDDLYCGSCNEGLPPEVVLNVKEGSALCCASCGRLLFISEEAPS